MAIDSDRAIKLIVGWVPTHGQPRVRLSCVCPPRRACSCPACCWPCRSWPCWAWWRRRRGCRQVLQHQAHGVAGPRAAVGAAGAGGGRGRDAGGAARRRRWCCSTFNGARFFEWALLLPLLATCWSYAWTDALQFSAACCRPVCAAGWRARPAGPDGSRNLGHRPCCSCCAHPIAHCCWCARRWANAVKAADGGRIACWGAPTAFDAVALPLARPALAAWRWR